MKALLFAALLGCAPLPALITSTQVRARFPTQIEAGMRCAARLNSHVRSARVAGIARPVLFGMGALFAGTGVAVRDVAPDAALPLAASGAVMSLLSDLILRLVADPADLLARHARGLLSWDAGLLERCVRDEAPERLQSVDSSGFAP